MGQSLSPVQNLTVVVPCFNESEAIQPLVERLCDLREDLSGLDSFRVILVDDGSGDDTWHRMQDITTHMPWIERLRHDQNRGITAAIMTGMRAATTEYVATLDSDCTYDPLQMRQLLAAVDGQVAIVTASPYHPLGVVLGVPGWRLLLSKAASTAYATVINVDLHTYTSCFRIYRRSVFVDLELRNQGFVGMAELLWMAIRDGGTVKETPAVLTSRRVGYSKLRTLPVIAGHLRLIGQIIYQRLSRQL
ncbi:MAG TPA: glycosyl transferase family 2 [Planctomycetaceae bacterium]|nr:glycosyl transferase family 2 [Planctomycetaceae bacterium]